MAEMGRAAVWSGYGRPIEIREYPVPDPEPGAIVVKVRLAGICGSDLHSWRGDFGTGPLPHEQVMGHEMTGHVSKLGQGVTTDSLGRPLREGDRVCYLPFFPCYRCYLCAKGEINFCPNRIWGGPPAGQWPYFNGAFADYYYLPPRHWVYKVPGELTDAVAVPVNCAVSTVMQGLIMVGVGQGDDVVIQGAGGLGLSATAIARDMGADRVIVLDRLHPRLELAREFGATHTINVDEYDTPQARIDRVWELTDGRGADVVAELVGMPALLVEGVEMLHNAGTLLELGNLGRGTVDFAPSSLLRGKGRRIVGGAMYKPHIIPKALDFLVRTRERYPFHKMVSHIFPLTQVNEAFAEAEWANRQTPVIRACLAP